MPNYENCVIYTIRSGDNLYVGSTCNFTKRKSNHNHYLKNENSKHHNFKVYKIIRENGGEYDMKPYKIFPCKNKLEMRIEEERCRVELNADLNTKACYLEDKYYYQKQYTKNTLREYNKEKIICECGCKVNRLYIYRHRKTKKHLELMENIKQ